PRHRRRGADRRRRPQAVVAQLHPAGAGGDPARQATARRRGSHRGADRGGLRRRVEGVPGPAARGQPAGRPPARDHHIPVLSVTDHCLRSRNYVNVIVAGKQPQPTWLDADAAALHCARGLGIWDWAGTDNGDPDVVLAAAGDVPTLEVLAAADLLRRHLPELKVRVINVVDLMRLQPADRHPHGLPDAEYDAIFTTDRPVIFAYHGYPWLIHRLTYPRAGHRRPPVRGDL